MLESSGYGLSALSYISGLIDLGVTVYWRPLVFDNGTYKPWAKINEPKQTVRRILQECVQDDDTIEKLIACLAPAETYSHILLHTVPEYWPNLIEKEHTNIGYTVWETTRLPKHFANLINQVDCVLVPSRFSVHACIKSGITIPIKTVPHILNPVVPANKDTKLKIRNRLNLNSTNNNSNFVFYTINEWNARKANWTLLDVFLNTFTKDEPVTLVIKTSPTGPSDEYDSNTHDTKSLVSHALMEHQNPPHVEIINEKITDQEISALHDIGDCFVSTTHSEGWGLGLFEAAGFSTPVIATGWGGQLAFLDPEHANLIDYSLVSTQDKLAFSYSEDQQWAQVDQKHASQLLRSVYENPKLAFSKAKVLAAKMNENYNANNVASLLRRAISKESIPNQFHFVFGFKQQTEPFHLAYYLCLKSCLEVNQPDAIHFHYHYEPHGPYWDLIKPELILHKVGLEDFVINSTAYSTHDEGRFITNQQLNYAHQADFVRLKALLKYGGVYADIDTLFVQALPEKLFEHQAVIGRENDVVLEGSETPSISLCNAVIMARPNSSFIDRWLNDSYQAFDGTWSKHSCQLAAIIASEMQDEVHILPEHNFYKHRCTQEGLRTLFEDLDQDFTEVYSMHMWNHLWWDKDRIDFSSFHSGLLDEQYILNGNTTYASVAKPFLPDLKKHSNSTYKDAYPERKENKSKIDGLLLPIPNKNWKVIEERSSSYLVDQITNAKFEINQTSKLIHSLCDGTINVSVLIDLISEEYKVSPNVISDDIVTALHHLEKHNIIRFE